METIDLYKFVTKNDIEYHYCYDGDVVMFVNNYDINDFYKLLGSSIFDDEGIVCNMKDGYFAFMMKDICEYFGIELSEIFENVEQ